MIDTIVLRFHAINDKKKKLQQQIAASNGHGSIMLVPEHYDLYKAISQFKGKYFHARKAIVRQQNQVSDYNDEEFLTRHIHEKNSQVMLFIDEDKVKELTMTIKGDYHVPSSYHGVTFRINENKGYIDFQLSIPKYLYGHSLAEFVPQINSERYNNQPHKAIEWEYQSGVLYKRLMDFIDVFCNDLCQFFQLEAMPNKKYIEIRRIDLCFNQWFKTKTDAMRYLEHMKIINHSRYKSNQKAPTDYNTSMQYYSSTGAYFKIYHKGTEYSMSENGDLKKHMEVNRKWADKVFKRQLKKALSSDRRKMLFDTRQNLDEIMQQMGRGEFSKDNYTPEQYRFLVKLYNAMPYKVDFFKKQMDKVLRYEVSLKGDFFAYYYKTKCFRRNCDIHNTAYLKYKEAKSLNDARNKGRELTQKEHKNFKMFNNFLNRKVFLMLDGSFTLKQWAETGKLDYHSASDIYKISRFGLNNTIMEKNDVALFEPYFLKWCVRYFKNIVDAYHVDTMHPDDDLERRIIDYNANVDKRVDEYNEKYAYLCRNLNGDYKMKNGKRVVHASQLLTEKQRSDKGLKKVRPMFLLAINEQIKRKRSLRAIRKTLNISPSQWTRYKRDLDKFGITDKTMIDPAPIDTVKNWSTYYDRLDDMRFFSNFYTSRYHATYE
jgi:hypothetical protein